MHAFVRYLPRPLTPLLFGALGLYLTTSHTLAKAEAKKPSRPNIVFVLSDDLGWGDLACYGNPEVKTPNLDRFAREGLRLTSCYAASANCSPARAGLLTGRTPYRVGVYSAIPMLSPMHLRAEEITIAKLLSTAGYETCHVGKWHLNGMFNLPGQPQPGDHGFDHSFSTQNNCLPNHKDPYDFVSDLIPVGPLEGYAAELVVDEAVRWLRDDRDPQQPFFLYVCFHEPHEPIRTEPRFAALYDFPDDPSRVAHHGNISQMDDAFGRLMKALETMRLSNDTMVWFSSDNGPERTKWHNSGSSGGLREYKGNVYEGGIRVPGIVRWPGHVAAGTTSDVPVCGLDFLPTACAITGIDPPSDRVLDGANVLPLLAGETFDRPKPLYWQFNHAHSEPCVAMRDGDWKVVARLTEHPQRVPLTAVSNKMLKEASLKSFELYNLRDDRGETTDLATREPQRLAAMVAVLDKQFREVQREAPVWPEWTDPGYERERIEWPDYLAKPLKKGPLTKKK